MGVSRSPTSGPIAFDTALFIYYIEEHPAYLPLIAPMFEAVAAGAREIVTSELTLLEVLVVPLRANDYVLARRYEALLTRSRGLRLVPLDRAHLRIAAQLRARYAVRTPDALQLAAALATQCSALVTNDRRLPAILGLPVLQLRELTEPL